MDLTEKPTSAYSIPVTSASVMGHAQTGGTGAAARRRSGPGKRLDKAEIVLDFSVLPSAPPSLYSTVVEY